MNLRELLDKREPLHPDLVPYKYKGRLGETIHHPLMIQIGSWPQMYAYYNAQYKAKLKAVHEAKEQGAWHTYVFLHERPYRLGALKEAVMLHGLKRGSTAFWNIVSDIWTDTENYWQNEDDWRMIWADPDLDPLALMDESELAKLESLPDVVDVYRGVQLKKAARGLSWTLNKDKAVWFANRLLRKNRVPYLVHGQVKKADIKAFFLGRGEEEVVSAKVKVKEIERLGIEDSSV